METERTDAGTHRSRWPRRVGVGAVAGFVAGVPMGLVFQFGTELLPVLGLLAGGTSVLHGWIVHLTISVAYGALFGAIVSSEALERMVGTFETTEYVLAGITYATMVAAVTLGLLPFVFEAPWVPASRPPIPTIPGPSLGSLIGAGLVAVGHLVYGAVLGGTYATLGDGRTPAR